MAVEQGTHLEAPIDVPSMTNAIHTNDTCLVVHCIENSIVSFSGGNHLAR
jgi:hypothetical protein